MLSKRLALLLVPVLIIAVTVVFPDPYHVGAQLLIGAIFGSWIAAFVAHTRRERIVAGILTTLSYPIAFYLAFLLVLVGDSPLVLVIWAIAAFLGVSSVVIGARGIRSVPHWLPIGAALAIIAVAFTNISSLILYMMPIFAVVGAVGTLLIIAAFRHVLTRSDMLLIIAFAVLASIAGVASQPVLEVGMWEYSNRALYVIFPIIVGWILSERVDERRAHL